MQRDLAALTNQPFDLLVIGGGMYGACVAWEATLRGLSVALVEQADFASGTSANSLKVIHGGLRYLQTADFPRMRQSIKERQTLMRIAPHLVHPMPVLIPTYGHSIKGKEAMTLALKLNDVISGDRNLPLRDPQKHIPPGEFLSKAQCLQQLPELPTQGLTGAAQFHDAQVYNSEQLVLSFVHSAANCGAQVANYTRVINVDAPDGQVTGAMAEDALTGDRFTIQARTIINASGPWVDQLIATAKGTSMPNQTLAKAMNLVTRPLFGAHQTAAVGITGRAPGSRLFFIAPWRGKSLVGTWYGPDNERTKPPQATSSEIADFLKDINQSYPTFDLTAEDVEWVHSGLLPCDGLSAKSGEMKIKNHFELIDHRRDGFKGLLSVKGVKYTTARDVARRAVDWAFRNRGQMPESSRSQTEKLQGGHIEQFTPFLNSAIHTYSEQVNATDITRLVYNYGSEYQEVLKLAAPSTQIVTGQTVTSPQTHLNILAAEVRYSLKNTMPQTLSDVIFRRTELGAAGHPGNQALQLCARIMGTTLGWSAAKQALEIAQVQQRYEQLYQPSSNTHPAPVPSPV
ncbi:MAG: glycerol-3-phosphate dehydrogenase/oxidase [Cyanobacteria bacterium J06634_6]